eukprot:CFRG6486T1
MRNRLLLLSHAISKLPEDELKELEHEESMYNAGWSLGKEKMGDVPDFAKGSFYANPLTDNPGTDEERAQYPWALPKNIWPRTLPELRAEFMALGRTMYDTVVLLAHQIDLLCEKDLPGYKKGTLHDLIASTYKVKGRLLYYFPVEQGAEDNWIGWHNDSGFLTALTSALFFNDTTGEVISNPDPNGGLYIVNRAGGTVRARIPPENLGVQCGECLQILTGGLLVATPHSVRSSEAPKGMKVGRGTFPVFVDTPPAYVLKRPEGTTLEQVFDKTPDSRVPPLSGRWQGEEVTFGDFLGNTFKQYYEWTTKPKEEIERTIGHAL